MAEETEIKKPEPSAPEQVEKAKQVVITLVMNIETLAVQVGSSDPNLPVYAAQMMLDEAQRIFDNMRRLHDAAEFQAQMQRQAIDAARTRQVLDRVVNRKQ